MSFTWNILYILPCYVNLRFTTLLKNQVEWIFRALLSCRHLYASCWFSWDILSLTESLLENFRLLSSLDLLHRFLRLYITEFFCLQHLNLTITLSVLFIRWQVCKSFGTTFTPVNDKALQMFSSKTSSVISAGTGFSSIVSLLLYWEFVTALHSSCIILVSKWELNFFHCCNSELILSYFDKKPLSFSSRLLSFEARVNICKFLNELFFDHILILTLSQNHIEMYRYLQVKSKYILKINLKMAEAQKDAYSSAFTSLLNNLNLNNYFFWIFSNWDFCRWYPSLHC